MMIEEIPSSLDSQPKQLPKEYLLSLAVPKILSWDYSFTEEIPNSSLLSRCIPSLSLMFTFRIRACDYPVPQRPPRHESER